MASFQMLHAITAIMKALHGCTLLVQGIIASSKSADALSGWHKQIVQNFRYAVLTEGVGM